MVSHPLSINPKEDMGGSWKIRFSRKLGFQYYFIGIIFHVHKIHLEKRYLAIFIVCLG